MLSSPSFETTKNGVCPWECRFPRAFGLFPPWGLKSSWALNGCYALAFQRLQFLLSIS
jgi:hypothetical protein